jgi:site-specific recombinase XerD
MRVRDVRFGGKTSVRLAGKGGGARVVTVPDPCGRLLEGWLEYSGKSASLDSHVFSSQTREHMTISCVEEIVKKYLRIAKRDNPALFREKTTRRARSATRSPSTCWRLEFRFL